MITIGDIEEFPALDPIPVYPVDIDPITNEVKVSIKKNSQHSSPGTMKTLCKASEDNNEVVVIIGSGTNLLVNMFVSLICFIVS